MRKTNDSDLEIASLNCRGLNKPLKRKSIFFKCLDYDIIALQETYINERTAKEWKEEWKGELFFSEGTNNRSKGQVILINKKLMYDDINIFYRTERILGIKLVIEDKHYAIINVYGPVIKDQKIKFINQLDTVISNHISESEKVVVCGDFNIVLDNTHDIIAGEDHNKEDVKNFNSWVTRNELIDCWRYMNKTKKDFTWSRPTPFTARRLDYIFCGENMISNIIQCKHEMIHTSDHKMVVLTIKTNDLKKGRSYWKFNNALLKDTCFIEKMNSCIEDHLLNYSNKDPNEKWEILKNKIKNVSLEYSLIKNRKMKKREREVQLKLNILNDQLIQQPNDTNLIKNYEKLKQEAGLYSLYKAKGAQVRSRIEWVEKGEKATIFFLNLEKSRGGENTIKTIQIADDVQNLVLTDPVDIVSHIKNHFEDIFKCENSSTEEAENIQDPMERFLEDIEIPSLDSDDINFCDAPLEIVELDDVIKSLNNHSAPGYDGITTPFYKFFWSKIRQPLYNSFLYSVRVTGELSATQRRGIITLLHKGKDLKRDELKNWRPITLTNTDYKIFSKIIASRLKTVLHKIIHLNQSGFMKGRLIENHIRLIDDIIHTSNKNNTPGMIVSIDFQKAFDSVSHEYIVKTLRKFNFGDNFINFIKVILSNTESCVQNGGWLSEWFNIEKGIKQGCSVSPLIFLLAVEILAMKIRKNKKIKGITLNNRLDKPLDTKILQYADDTNLIISNENSLIEALSDIESFSKFSGLKLNRKKSLGMWIGSSKNIKKR